MSFAWRRWMWVLPLLLYAGPVMADTLPLAPADTVHALSQDPASYDADEGPDPGLGLMLLFFLIVMAISMLAAAIVLAIIVLLVVVLAAWGIVGVSLLVGVHQNSFKKGFRVFWILGSTLGTAFLGLFMGLLVDLVWGEYFYRHSPIWMGGVAGLVGGGLFGYGSFQLLQYVFTRIVAYVQSKRKPA